MHHFVTALTILPKYLWKQIYSFLCYTDHAKLIIFDNNYYRDQFFNHSNKNIAVVVSSNNTRNKRSWLDALLAINIDKICHIGKIINNYNLSDNSSTFKVYFKAGIYYNSFGEYHFNDYKFGLELIGSETGITKMTDNQSDTISINAPLYFSMSNIVFYRLNCIITNNITSNSGIGIRIDDWQSRSSYYLQFHKNRSSNKTTKSTVYISNCDFSKNGMSYRDMLKLENIANATISNCKFTNVYAIKIDIDQYINYTPLYIIKNCIFIKCIICCDLKNNNMACNVAFDNNIVTNSDTIIILSGKHSFRAKSVLLIRLNCISNVSKIVCYSYIYEITKVYFANRAWIDGKNECIEDTFCNTLSTDNCSTKEVSSGSIVIVTNDNCFNNVDEQIYGILKVLFGTSTVACNVDISGYLDNPISYF